MRAERTPRTIRPGRSFRSLRFIQPAFQQRVVQQLVVLHGLIHAGVQLFPLFLQIGMTLGLVVFLHRAVEEFFE